MTDLSKLSDADLLALKSGDMSKVSDEGLAHLSGAPVAQPSLGSRIDKQVGNTVAGLVRGAGSIGATLLAPIDMAKDALNGKGLSLESNRERRKGMDEALSTLGADTGSFAYGAGKLGGEIAGTAGVGGAVANTLGRSSQIAAAAPNLLSAIRTSGMTGGNLLTRAAGGAVTGGASAGLVNPEDARTGAMVGGALPVATKVAGLAGSAIGTGVSDVADWSAKRLMQSAIKPTLKQLKNGDAETAVQTLLDYGLNPTRGGVNKLRELIDAKNAEIASQIGSSTASVDKQNVLASLAGVRQKFGNQVSPTGDLASIQGVADDFLAHPNLPGNSMPVQAAQELKQGTYRVLSGKYGQMGSAETEAQKALARGLKDEIATAVPGVGPLNAEESRLLTTLSVSERRALMELNKNPMGLAALAHNPVSWVAFMADKSALFKSLAARAANKVADVPNAVQALAGSAPQQLGYRAAPVLAGAQ